jgi:primosomal protein N' (replication factor Y)
VRARLPQVWRRGGETEVLGPAALFRLRGRERQTLLVKASERRQAVRAVGDAVHAVAAGGTHARVAFSVDVEPQ